MSEGDEKSRIVIDEDWKAKVQAEKEATRLAPNVPSQSAGLESRGPAEGSPVKTSAGAEEGPLPPSSLTFLCTTIATQAMIALGQIPNPITGKVDVRPKQAKHYIDTLGMLEEKTKGNRTAGESALFDEILHQLRMAFVMLQKEQGAD
jgi:Domain of unknown function (DUF1844)